MYFQSIRTNTNRMQKIVPYTNFAKDIAGSTMPNYVWISPDQCSDMHGLHADTAAYADAGFCAGTAADNDMSPDVIKFGDAFVGDLVKKIMAGPTWNEGSAIIIVFDEDDYVQQRRLLRQPDRPGRRLPRWRSRTGHRRLVAESAPVEGDGPVQPLLDAGDTAEHLGPRLPRQHLRDDRQSADDEALPALK